MKIAPGAPPQVVAVYVTALAAVTMTLAATLSAPSMARRRIGVGFALMVASGYAFASIQATTASSVPRHPLASEAPAAQLPR